jgi:hypothetical protein
VVTIKERDERAQDEKYHSSLARATMQRRNNSLGSDEANSSAVLSTVPHDLHRRAHLPERVQSLQASIHIPGRPYM